MLAALGLLETIFLTLEITLTEGATNAVPPCIFGVPVQVVLLSLWALSILVFHLDEGSEERIAGVGGTDGEEEMKPFRCNAGQKGRLFDSLKLPDTDSLSIG